MKIFPIKKAFASIGDSLDRDPGKSVFRPDRAWRLILLYFAAACAASAIFSFYLYKGIEKENIFGVGSDNKDSLSTVNREKLERALETLRSQDALEKALEKKPPSVADPSR